MLRRYGYRLGSTPKQLATIVEEWAFSLVLIEHSPPKPMLERVFSKCFHTGGEDEFDWFCQQIPPDAWHELYSSWSAPEFLDRSDAGAQQCADLQYLVWRLLDLDNSKAHQKYLIAMATMYAVDEELYGAPMVSTEDPNPAESRRTFSST